MTNVEWEDSRRNAEGKSAKAGDRSDASSTRGVFLPGVRGASFAAAHSAGSMEALMEPLHFGSRGSGPYSWICSMRSSASSL